MKTSIKLLVTITVVVAVFNYLAVINYKNKNNNKNANLTVNTKGKIIKKIAIFADIHDSTNTFEIALKQIPKDTFLFILGDSSNTGQTEELLKIKNILQNYTIEYNILPGDRDVGLKGELPPPIGGYNFNKVFNENICDKQYSIKLDNDKLFNIVCVNNPYNYTLLPKTYIEELKNNIQKAHLIIMSQPLQNPGFNKYMGHLNKDVLKQAEEIKLEINKNKNIKYIISSDTHFFSRNSDIRVPDQTHITVGAITNERNLQSPRYLILNIFEDKSVEVKDVLVTY